jgi:hypothetical protein
VCVQYSIYDDQNESRRSTAVIVRDLVRDDFDYDYYKALRSTVKQSAVAQPPQALSPLLGGPVEHNAYSAGLIIVL